MADTPLSIVHAGESTACDANSPLPRARALIASGDRTRASRVLNAALDADSLTDSPQRALALLALALIASEDARWAEALRLLERAETMLVLTGHEEAIVRWDIWLARARALAESGRIPESAACARTAIVLFEESRHTVAWNRPLLVDLERLGRADDDPCTPFLLPKALGALGLTDRYAAMQWLALRESIVHELVRRDSTDLAADHAAKTLCALPVDLFGTDEWWPVAMQYLGRVGASDVLGAAGELMLAFRIIEGEFEEMCEYEREAPLLPRERVTDR